MVTSLHEVDGTPLRNVDAPDLELPGEVAETSAERLPEEAVASLAARFKEVLGDRITEARSSTVLRDNPVRLVSPPDAPSVEMQRVQRLMERDFSVPPKIVEINPAHPLIHDLAALASAGDDQETLDAVIGQLYDSALLAEGLLPRPAAMLPRIQALMAAAVRRSAERRTQSD
jgi:molecular chaperone HtpG